MPDSSTHRGGSFLTGDSRPEEVFTPEDLTEAHLAVKEEAERFVRDEVLPNIERVNDKDVRLHRDLLLKAGSLGLLGPDIEARYGGTGLDKISAMLMAAASTAADGFSLTWNVHSGIGTLPLSIFGNQAQKDRYLSDLVGGRRVGAYALTEPQAGSDALSIQTTAILSPNGKHYVLNGQKLFISNSTLADIIFTYAKVGGDKFTAFIVDRHSAGVTVGPEVKKMGQRGSFTANVTFKDVRVPVENVLHEIGKGYEVAFCILDLGRFRLAVGCVERGRAAIEQCARYCTQRKQFGKPIGEFGLVQQKLADMAIMTYIGESVVYRAAALWDRAYSTLTGDADLGKELYRRISEYTAEFSISKVLCSEILDFIADEAVQIYGGRGYIEGNPAEKMYRDSRVNRIYEGTNEINRLLIVRWLLRKASAGEIPLFSLAARLEADLPGVLPVLPGLRDGPLDYQKRLLDMAKKAFILVCGAAARKYETAIEDQQEILAYLSDIMIDIYAMESGLLRAMKSLATLSSVTSSLMREGQGGRDGRARHDVPVQERAALKTDMVRVFINDSVRRIEDNAIRTIAAMETGDVLAVQLAALRKLCRLVPADTVSARRRIARAVLNAGQYVL